MLSTVEVRSEMARRYSALPNFLSLRRPDRVNAGMFNSWLKGETTIRPPRFRLTPAAGVSQATGEADQETLIQDESREKKTDNSELVFDDQGIAIGNGLVIYDSSRDRNPFGVPSTLPVE